MTLNGLKGLQMSLCVSNKLSKVIWSHLKSFEIIWSHLSHEATKLCNAAQKCTVLFWSVSTTDVGDSASTKNSPVLHTTAP